MPISVRQVHQLTLSILRTGELQNLFRNKKGTYILSKIDPRSKMFHLSQKLKTYRHIKTNYTTKHLSLSLWWPGPWFQSLSSSDTFKFQNYGFHSLCIGSMFQCSRSLITSRVHKVMLHDPVRSPVHDLARFKDSAQSLVHYPVRSVSVTISK